MAGPSIPKDPVVEQLHDVWAALDELCAGLSDDEWARPSPCPGWTVKDVVAHVIGTESMLAGRTAPDVDVGGPPHVRNDIGRLNEAWVAARRPVPPAEVLAELRDVVAQRSRQLQAMPQEEFDAPSWTPAGQGTYGRFMQIRVFDQWVHEQDVRDAVGRPGHLDGPAARAALDEVVRAMGFVVGKRASAPDGSSVVVHVAGSTGRDVAVTVADGRARVVEAVTTPTAEVATDLTTFMRLACGRIGPDEPLADGRVTLGGDRALAERVARSLAFVV